MKEKLFERLTKLASRSVWDDGIDDGDIVDDYAGGNVDDAYDGGRESGETLLARSILNELGVKFVKEIN